MAHHPEPPEPDKLGESALSPFDRRVAVTIAALTAGLAFVSMLAASAQGEVLFLHVTATQEQLAANTALGKAHAARERFAQAHQGVQRDKDFLRVIELLPDDPGTRAARAKGVSEVKAQIAREEKTAAQLLAEADRRRREADEQVERAAATMRRGGSVHEGGRALDRGELFLQLAIVLCSLAILTKWRWYWLVGSALGGVGLVMAAVAALSGG
ncbi:MAG: DUF4337 domain-containing protein [Gemmataceae bacterium]|nr:DUF4337 domain-containing protein [Gemmataceae bacterium]